MQAIATAPAQTAAPIVIRDRIEHIATRRANMARGCALAIRHPNEASREALDLESYIDGIDTSEDGLLQVVTFRDDSEQLADFCFDWFQMRLASFDIRGIEATLANRDFVIASLTRY